MTQLCSMRITQVMGGATESIFYEFELRINENNKSIDALQHFIQGMKTPDNYQSLIDFLVCEFFPKHKQLCREFYKNHKKSLKDVISPEEKASIEVTLMLLLDLLEVYFDENVRICWTEIKIISPRVIYH